MAKYDIIVAPLRMHQNEPQRTYVICKKFHGGVSPDSPSWHAYVHMVTSHINQPPHFLFGVSAPAYDIRTLQCSSLGSITHNYDVGMHL